MYAKKSLGQNFLTDKNYVHKIIDTLDVAGKTVLEIGPGEGVMTSFLVQKASQLYCVEKDDRLVTRLRSDARLKETQIICGDILTFDMSVFSEKIVVFGNVPYYISNDLMRYLVDNRAHISEVFLTLQKEFAQKIFSAYRTDQYGFLSCYMQYYASGRVLFSIPKTAFYPIPKVDSSFLSFRFQDREMLSEEKEKLLFSFLKKVFSQRRKKIRNSIKGWKYQEKYTEAFIHSGIDLDSRPEEIALSDYIRLIKDFEETAL